MYGCESCIIKKAEHWRIDAFELWCWRRLLRVPLTLRRCIQSTLKEISPGCSLEGLMLKLKLQYFGHLMWRADFNWKDPDTGKDWRQGEKGMTENEMVGWHHRLDGHEFESARSFSFEYNFFFISFQFCTIQCILTVFWESFKIDIAKQEQSF